MKLQPLILATMLSVTVSAHAQTQASRTADVIARFNQAFERHDASLLEDLIAEDCVMERDVPRTWSSGEIWPTTRTARSAWKTSWCSAIAQTFAGAIASVPASRNPSAESR